MLAVAKNANEITLPSHNSSSGSSSARPSLKPVAAAVEMKGINSTITHGAVTIAAITTYSTWDTLRILNNGNAPLTVSLVTSDNPAFTPGRTSFVVAADSVDTLSIWYLPGAPGPDSALFTFTTDDPAGPHTVRLRGTGTEAVGVPAVTLAFALDSPRPNPFAGETTVQFSLAERSAVALEVFDLSGRRVATLAEGVRDPGPYSILFRPGAARGAGDGGGGLSAGVYFVRLTAGSHVATRKLLYLAR